MSNISSCHCWNTSSANNQLIKWCSTTGTTKIEYLWVAPINRRFFISSKRERREIVEKNWIISRIPPLRFQLTFPFSLSKTTWQFPTWEYAVKLFTETIYSNLVNYLKTIALNLKLRKGTFTHWISKWGLILVDSGDCIIKLFITIIYGFL